MLRGLFGLGATALDELKAGQSGWGWGARVPPRPTLPASMLLTLPSEAVYLFSQLADENQRLSEEVYRLRLANALLEYKPKSKRGRPRKEVTKDREPRPTGRPKEHDYPVLLAIVEEAKRRYGFRSDRDVIRDVYARLMRSEGRRRSPADEAKFINRYSSALSRARAFQKAQKNQSE